MAAFSNGTTIQTEVPSILTLSRVEVEHLKNLFRLVRPIQGQFIPATGAYVPTFSPIGIEIAHLIGAF